MTFHIPSAQKFASAKNSKLGIDSKLSLFIFILVFNGEQTNSGKFDRKKMPALKQIFFIGEIKRIARNVGKYPLTDYIFKLIFVYVLY